MSDFNESKYKNDFAKKTYDRLNIQVKKGMKLEIEKHRKSKGYKSLNDYVCELIRRDMSNTNTIIVTEMIEQNGDNNTINIG